MNPYRCWCFWLKAEPDTMRECISNAEEKRRIIEDAKHHAYIEGQGGVVLKVGECASTAEGNRIRLPEANLPTEQELKEVLLQAGQGIAGGKGQKLSRVEYEAEYLLIYLEARHE